MKQSVYGACILVVTLLATGCSTTMFERQTGWKNDPFSRTIDYSSADFEVLGPVEAAGRSVVVMGLVTGGREGYGLLMEAARKKYGDDVTTVMFIFSSYYHTGVLYPVVGKISTKYMGTAVKLKTVSQTPTVRLAPQKPSFSAPPERRPERRPPDKTAPSLGTESSITD